MERGLPRCEPGEGLFRDCYHISNGAHSLSCWLSRIFRILLAGNRMGIRTPGRLLPVILLVLAATPAMGDMQAADAAFDIGNAAFRSGDYGRALDKYNEAMSEGKNSPRLFYNMGLAHYRLAQYPQARSAFMESKDDQGLAALSYYQLGVLANKAGNMSEAESWFRKSRKTADSSRLRDMSTEALVTIGARPSELQVMVSAGFGHDNNAFRAPSDPYVDLSQDPSVLVVPVEQSGAYVPVRIGAAFSNPLSTRSKLVLSYQHRGDYYTDSELDNANVMDHRLFLAMKRYLDGGRSETRRFGGEVFFRSHAETNFDRDDGLDRFDDGASIADRFDFNAVGAEFSLKNRFGANRYEIQAGFSQRDYEDVPTASPYDLDSLWFEGALKMPLGSNSRIKVAYGYHDRSFDERRARDATGDASIDNPTLEYRYQVIELGIRHRFNDSIVTELTYSYTQRDDDFVGYNDYTRDKIELDTRFDITDKIAASFKFDYRDQQYPNAFAFDDPTQPQKEYQDLEMSVGAVYRFTEQLSLRAEIRQDDVDSSDPRGEYDRLRTRLGVYWRF